MLATIATFIQEVPDIEQKMKDAPDGGYELGVTIGAFLPYAIFVIFAYIIYYRMKKRKSLDK